MKTKFMKTLLLSILLLTIINSNAQNGFTTVSFPVSGVTNISRCLTIDNQGNKWVGDSRKGISKYNDTTWTTYDTLNSGIASNKINCIGFNTTNKGWFGTDKGLSTFDGTNWLKYNTANSGLPSNNITSICVDGNSIWLATDSGLVLFNGINWTNYKISNSSILSNQIKCLAVETNGTLWIGTMSGICQFSGNTFTSFTTSNSGLTNNAITGIYIDSIGDKWLGTGVYLCRIKGSVILPINQIYPNINFSSGNNIYSIFTGPHKGIIFNNGNIVEITSQKMWVSYFNSYAYLPYMEFDKLRSKYWFCGGSNLISFDPNLYSGYGRGPTPDNNKTLDVNQVKAGLHNRGDWGWDLVGNSRYEVPKGSGKHALFSGALWIGGIDAGGALHQAAMTYRQSGMDYFPGPLDTINGATDTTTAIQYDKIWKIDKWKIEEFKNNFASLKVQNGTYIVDNEILSWPASGIGNYSRDLAPFIDVNNNGIYNPITEGDYPDIKGDQMLYWIFNDNLSPHTETDGTPLKVEVHASAYAYSCPNSIDSNKAIEYTTFYNFKVFNRSNINYTNTRIGVWADTDLGHYNDDYVGCDSTLNYGYTYNGDNDDEGAAGYGQNPPMFGTVILNGPLADANDGIDNNNNGIIDENNESCLLNSYMCYNNNFTKIGNPEKSSDFYNYMSSAFRDSSCLRPNGWYSSTGTGIRCSKFMFPDVPYDTIGWTETTCGNYAGDRRFVCGTGSFTFNAGTSFDYDFALVFSWDSTISYGTKAYFDNNFNDVKQVAKWFKQNNYPSCLQYSTGKEESNIRSVTKFALYPNPANNTVSLTFENEKNGTICLLDITGKTIGDFSISNKKETIIDLSTIANGIYAITFNNDYLSKIVVNH